MHESDVPGETKQYVSRAPSLSHTQIGMVPTGDINGDKHSILQSKHLVKHNVRTCDLKTPRMPPEHVVLSVHGALRVSREKSAREVRALVSTTLYIDFIFILFNDNVVSHSHFMNTHTK